MAVRLTRARLNIRRHGRFNDNDAVISSIKQFSLLRPFFVGTVILSARSSTSVRPAFLEILIRSLACMPAYTVRHLLACVPACLTACPCACLPSCPHACMPAFLPAFLSACMHACLPACLHACMPACGLISVGRP